MNFDELMTCYMVNFSHNDLNFENTKMFEMLLNTTNNRLRSFCYKTLKRNRIIDNIHNGFNRKLINEITESPNKRYDIDSFMFEELARYNFRSKIYVTRDDHYKSVIVKMFFEMLEDISKQSTISLIHDESNNLYKRLFKIPILINTLMHLDHFVIADPAQLIVTKEDLLNVFSENSDVQ